MVTPAARDMKMGTRRQDMKPMAQKGMHFSNREPRDNVQVEGRVLLNAHIAMKTPKVRNFSTLTTRRLTSE